MTKKEALVMINYIVSSRPKLNAWEVKFIENIVESEFRTLTANQSLCLKNIYKKVFGGSDRQERLVV